ncbi:MAG TPA: sugar MFS transporter [Verrucomicrobiae bacterium]|nr:sugar MFS transporter [Verrucomicrobiae bacterium]
MAIIGAATTQTASSSPPENGKSYRGPFAIMTVLFFMWGFITVLNDILIPRLQDAFTLTNYEIMFVQTAFFGAYFIGSLLYFLVSATAGDPIARIGYKNGVVIGLLLAGLGSALFWPAASLLSYPLFLGALFVVGLGLTMLQIACNPYVTILGPERTASSRLNLAQAFNSLGTTTGPLVGGYLIYQYFAKTGMNGADSVKMPYLAFCIIFVIIALIFFFLHLPHIGEGKVEAGISSLKYPHVVLGVLAIFMYVGGEVSVGSQIIKYLGQPDVAGLAALEASKYVSLYWGGMLVGRFMGAVELSEMKSLNKRLILAAIPMAAFLILLSWRGWDMVKMYLPLLALCWLFFQFGKGLAGRTLFVFSATIVVLLGVAILFGGRLAMWCVVGVGLFTSIGWPNIFSLALDRMGVLKSQVSSLLVMAVVGGAILPPIMGKVADHWNRQWAFVVPLLAYAYVAFYGWKGHKIGRVNG